MAGQSLTIILTTSSETMVEPSALKDHKGESRIYFERAAIGLGVSIFLTLFLVGRLFYLQIVQHNIYTTLSDKNRIQVQPLPPIRGLIYDRNGELIAENIPSYDLTVTIERVDDLDATLAKISELIGISDRQEEGFRKRLKRRQRPFESVPVRFKLSREEIARISVDRYSMPGVEIEAKLIRHYPKGELMAHAVGSVRRINEKDVQRLNPVAYSGTDHVGKIGIEKFYEADLLGTVGYQRVETNAPGVVCRFLPPACSK